MIPPRDNTATLCNCKGISWGQVREAVTQGGARTVLEVKQQTTAGTGCQTCHPDIEAALADAQSASGTILSRLFMRLFSK